MQLFTIRPILASNPPAIADENGDGALFGGGISRSENTFAIFTAVDLIDDVENQVAVLTLRTDCLCLFVEGVVVMEPFKKKIKHDEPPFVSPVLKADDRHNGEARQGDQSKSDAVPALYPLNHSRRSPVALRHLAEQQSMVSCSSAIGGIW